MRQSPRSIRRSNGLTPARTVVASRAGSRFQRSVWRPCRGPRSACPAARSLEDPAPCAERDGAKRSAAGYLGCYLPAAGLLQIGRQCHLEPLSEYLELHPPLNDRRPLVVLRVG